MDNVENITEGFTKAINETAQEVLGQRRAKKQQWISNETVEMCDKRRKAKQRKENSEEEMEEYKKINREVRKALLNDKEEWIVRECAKIDNELKSNNSKAAFELVK